LLFPQMGLSRRTGAAWFLGLLLLVLAPAALCGSSRLVRLRQQKLQQNQRQQEQDQHALLDAATDALTLAEADALQAEETEEDAESEHQLRIQQRGLTEDAQAEASQTEADVVEGGKQDQEKQADRDKSLVEEDASTAESGIDDFLGSVGRGVEKGAHAVEKGAHAVGNAAHKVSSFFGHKRKHKGKHKHKHKGKKKHRGGKHKRKHLKIAIRLRPRRPRGKPKRKPKRKHPKLAFLPLPKARRGLQKVIIMERAINPIYGPELKKFYKVYKSLPQAAIAIPPSDGKPMPAPMPLGDDGTVDDADNDHDMDNFKEDFYVFKPKFDWEKRKWLFPDR